MRLTYKYRLSPTKAQRTALDSTLEACRLVYNKTLATRKEAYEQEGVSLSRFDTIKMLPAWKEQMPILNGVHSQVLQEVCARVDLAFKAFFRRARSGEEPGYPRFKGYGRYDSFTFPQSGFSFLDNGKLRMSKIGDVPIKLHREIRGEIKTLTVQRDTFGNWYACFSCEVEPRPLPPADKVVGVDLGLKTFAVMSDGNKIERERWMKRDAKDVARLQRKKEKLAKGSPERRKVVRALQHAYRRSSRRRDDFAHKVSRDLVNTYQVICLEKLDIVDMQSQGNRVINRGIADVAWGKVAQYCIYKAEDAGRTVVQVNPRGTTQECSGCYKIVPKDLSVRVHDCPHCGLRIDRDLNAAINILRRGLASLGIQSVEAQVL